MRLPMRWAGLCLALFATPASAGIVDQVWIGGFAHDVNDIGAVEGGTWDATIELDSGRPQLLRPIGAPRVNLVAALNTAGKTSLYSVGLTWDRRLFSQLYGSLDLGLGGSNGLIRARPWPQGLLDGENRLILGSRILFREAVGLEWRFGSNWSVGAQFVHASNGGILGDHRFNRGINDAGLRFGYRFR